MLLVEEPIEKIVLELCEIDFWSDKANSSDSKSMLEDKPSILASLLHLQCEHKCLNLKK